MDFENKQNIESLLEYITLLPYEKKKENKSSEFIVFTGILEKFSREEAKKISEEKGFKTSESLTKKITYLVYGNSPGSKKKKAELLGVKCLTEKEWLSLVDLDIY